MKRQEPYTFLVFAAGNPAHAIELHPTNLALWKTLCGAEHNRTTGAVVHGARRCWSCRMEIQKRGKGPKF